MSIFTISGTFKRGFEFRGCMGCWSYYSFICFIQPDGTPDKHAAKRGILSDGTCKTRKEKVTFHLPSLLMKVYKFCDKMKSAK